MLTRTQRGGVVAALGAALGLLAWFQNGGAGLSSDGTDSAPSNAAAAGPAPAGEVPGRSPPGAREADARFAQYRQWRRDPGALARARRQADEARSAIKARRKQRSELPGAGGNGRHTGGSAGLAEMPALEGSGNQSDKPLGDYIRGVMRDDFIPLGRSCYEDLLASQRSARGRLDLQVVIAGDRSVGGVVSTVDFGPDSTLLDQEEFVTCIEESMLAVQFASPPGEEGEVDFTYPLVFEPGTPDAGP